MGKVGRLAMLAALSALLAGCGDTAVALPTPLPTLEPTQTPEVAFTVAITAVRGPTPAPTARPTPTRFVAPHGPYIVLLPSTGPPASRQITVRGANLPPSTAMQIGWSRDGRSSPIAREAGTNSNGDLWTQFAVPASIPGRYRVVAMVGGRKVAGATYEVVSEAILTASASPAGAAERIRVRGVQFLPGMKLLLVAYPMSVRGKAIVVGQTRCGAKGGFKFHSTLNNLAPGQYVLRAYSRDALSAQMGETFFQVVI